MPFVPFLSSSDTYLNYQRPRGFLDVFAANTVTGLGTHELLQRFLAKNLKVIDSAAVSIARDNSIPIKIFSILKKNCFKNVYYNKSIYSEIKDV